MASVAGDSRARPTAAAGLNRFAPQSSWISEIEYDPTSLTLTTHLKSGAIYQHKFVTPSDFEALKTAKNPSQHWTTAIKGKKASTTVKKVKAPNSELRKGRVYHL